MSDHLAWQMFLTRWVILFVVTFVVGIWLNGVTALIAKDKEPYKGKALWWTVFVVLAVVHIGGFLYRHSLPHWVLSASAGFFTALGATLMMRWIFDLLAVKANIIGAVMAGLGFALVANFTQVEAMLIDWCKAL